MEIYFFKHSFRSICVFIFLVLFSTLKIDVLKAEDSYLYLEEMEIDSSTKNDGSSSEIPTNPFEIVEMIRRQNSLNDATNPSDAIDDALESFNSLEEKEEI